MALAITYISQASAQAALTHFETSNSWFFEQVNKVSSVVYAVNLGAVFIGVKHLIDGVEPWLGFYANVLDYGEAYFFGGLLLGLAWMATAIGIIAYINNRLRPEIDLAQNIQDLAEEERNEIDVVWDNSSYQLWMQGFHLTQLVTSVALIFFSTNPCFYAACAGLQLYSLLKTSTWKSIRVDRTFIQPPPARDEEGYVGFRFSYYFAALPPSRVEQCGVCRDQDTAAAWHGNHSFCYPCSIRHIAVHSGQIQDHLRADNVHSVHNIERGQFGNIQSERMSHNIQIPSAAIPSCPLCREHPAQNQLEMQVQYRYRSERNNVLLESMVPAVLTILPPPPLQPQAPEPA